MNFRITVTYLDDRKTDKVDTRPVDAIKFERKFDVPVTVMQDAVREVTDDDGVTRQEPTASFRMEWLWSLAFWAVQRTDSEVGDFDAWAENVDEISFNAGGAVPLDQ